MKSHHVFIWENNGFQATYLERIYQQAGFKTHLISGYVSLREALRSHLHQTVLIVIGLSPETHLKYLQSLHHFAPLASILVISADQELQVSLDLYAAGADAYLVSPLQAELLILQSQALLNQTHRVSQHHLLRQNQQSLRLGPLTLDLQARQMDIEGQVQKLSKREFLLLQYFCEHPNQALSRKRLYDLLWPGQIDFRSRQLDNLILALRRKLADLPSLDIQTRYGEGYLLHFVDS